MGIPNTDLLPPLFEQILSFFGHADTGGYVRADIVKIPPEVKVVILNTFDRLSGANISRAALVEQLITTTGLDPLILEIALLLIEAQIDLRLKGGPEFTIAGIKFSCDAEHRED